MYAEKKDCKFDVIRNENKRNANMTLTHFKKSAPLYQSHVHGEIFNAFSSDVRISNHPLKIIQCFNPGNNTFVMNRTDPSEADGFGSTNGHDALGQAVTLRRDHIIPLSKIQRFADIVFSTNSKNVVRTGEAWLNQATRTYLERGEIFGQNPNSHFYTENNGMKIELHSQDATFLQDYIHGKKVNKKAGFSESDYFMVLEKAITWMPGNIIMAPMYKIGDPGNELDTTAKAVVTDFALFEITYQNMYKVINIGTINKQSENYAMAALEGLKMIAELPGPWPFNPKHWKYKGTADGHAQYQAKSQRSDG